MKKEFWDERFGREDYAYGKEVNDFLRMNYRLLPEKGKILCIAEGEGRNGVFLAGMGYEVICIDQSDVGKNKALALARERNVTIEYCLGNLETCDFEGDWDGVVSIFAHLRSEYRRRLHVKIEKSMKPGGILILEAYNKKQLSYDTGGPKNPDMLISLDDLRKEFASYQILLCQDIEREIHEGVYHTGLSSVVQFIARK